MAQNLEDLINALFDCVTSGPSQVLFETASNTLNTLGGKQPALFLSVTHAYILQRSRLSSANRAFLLNSMTRVLEVPGVLEECDEQQVLLIINLATNEMTMAKESEETWANAAKDVLVTLAKSQRFVSHVMDAILNKYPPGHTSPPHKYVILALAAMSQHNAIGFLPFLTDILSRTVPLLSHLKNDVIRSAWSQALCCFCDAVMECSSEEVKDSSMPNGSNLAEDDCVSIGTKLETIGMEYADQLESTYEVVFNWTSAKDAKCRADAAECIGTLCQLISRQRVNRDLKKTVSMFLALYRKTSALQEIFSITKGIANFLNACCSDETLQVEHYLDDIFNAFFPHVCVVTEQSLSAEDCQNSTLNITQIKIRNEAFRCFQIASRRFANRQIYYLFHKMQNDKDSVKLGATNLMRHLLNCSGTQMDDNRPLITMGLKPLLTDETLSIRVKMSICQLCVALADHGYVHDEAGGEHVVQFLLTNLILKPDPLAKKSSASGGGSGSEAVSLDQLHMQCAQAMHTIANTCASAFNLLWPLLFEYVCAEAYTPVITDILKCLRILMFRAREAGQTLDFVTDFDTSPRIAGPHQVMARLFVCMNGAPLNSLLQSRATEALKVLSEIGVWFHASIPPVLAEFLPQIMALVEETNSFFLPVREGDRRELLISAHNNNVPSMNSGPHHQRYAQHQHHHHRRCDYSSLELKCARTQRWQAHVLDLMNACVCAVNNGEWRQQLAAAQAKQLQLYNDNSHDKAFLLRCLGQTLSRITHTSFVVEHTMLLFRMTTHSNQIERVGCAMAVGHCAQTHTDLMLTELENVSKWEHAKKGGTSIFSFIKDAMPYGKTLDIEMVYLRATLVLCYGYIVYYCPPEMVVQRLEQTVLPFLRQYIASCKDTAIKEAHLETINLIALTVHPSHLNSDYKFEARYECFSYIKQYVQVESPETLSSWVRLLAAKATASLVQLDPPISDNEMWDIGTVLTQQTFPICREKSGLKTLDPLSVSGFLLSPLISVTAANPLHAMTNAGIHHRFPSAYHHRPVAVNSSLPPGGVAGTTPIATNGSVDATTTTPVQKSGGRGKRKLSSTPLNGGGSSSSSYKASVTVGVSGSNVATNGGASTMTKFSATTTTTSLRIDDDEASTVMDATVMQYRNAIGHIVARQPFVETLSQLLKMFINYFGSLADHERTRAIDSTVLILSVYAESAADCTLGHANDFQPLSSLLGRLGPRLADSLQAVRILSIRAIWLSFKLSLLRRGHSPQDTELVDSTLFDVPAFVDRYLGHEGKLDSMNCRSAIIAISKEIEKRLPQSQVQLYISVLFKMLADRQSNVSSSAAELLSIIVSDRGHLLQNEAEILVSTMLEHLPQVHSFIQSYTVLLNGFSLFAGHQPYVAVDVLLKQQLPYTVTNVDAWQIIARDSVQFPITVDYVLELTGAGATVPPMLPSSASQQQQPLSASTVAEGGDAAKQSIHQESDEKSDNDDDHCQGDSAFDDTDEALLKTTTCGDEATSAAPKGYRQPSAEDNNNCATATPPVAISLRTRRASFTAKANRGSTSSLPVNTTAMAMTTASGVEIMPHYEVIDIGGGTAVKIVSNEACALTAALKELIRNGDSEDALFSRIPAVLAALLKILAAVVDTQFPSAQRPASGTACNNTDDRVGIVSAPLSPTGIGGSGGTGATAAGSSATLPVGGSGKGKRTTQPSVITAELCRFASTPAGLVADALKTLLLRIHADSVVETMNSERAFTHITQPQTYILAITTMCRSLADHRPKFVGSLVRLMAARVASACVAERTASVAVLAALVTRCPKENGDFDPDLFVVLFKALGQALKDSKLIVRKLAIRGHGLLGALNTVKSLDDATRVDLLNRFAKVAVNAALSGLDDAADRSDQLAIEAVDALDALVGVTEKRLLVNILPQLLLRIRPCFEKENASLRSASFSLFAGLGTSVGDCEAYKKSLHNNIVSVLLHLNDVDETVQCRCAQVLCATAPLLNSEHATALVEREIIANRPTHNYATFLKDFSMILALSFPDRLNYYALNCSNYFKSQSARIRQNAALMTGLLLSALTSELRGTLSKDLIFSGLVQLLKDPEEEVRLTTIKSIACLHAFS